ncbi:septal ring lytic transglycosylase RlpA family protein [Roseomonas xinghualingensis]|uniref:septal ring lytic transglycosylase RlpA family protein n=1 Tax=Roseomonas xinghualingensis TaxID=2986475 RepID=UPI0021F15B2B|nr:septal ring lytic transglycosylase RlpA family protein [Roseomonas sp. SXEYE001]MCV4207377.1 septal ring lytic transglycosylase RlpA family protein [Roseomonas sp. SXEYE001]
MKSWMIALFCAALGLAGTGSSALMARTAGDGAKRAEARASRHAPVSPTSRNRPRPHRSQHAGRTQRGQASIYSNRLHGKRMADGSRFDAQSNTVASKTLPLGSRARVTNLSNGRSVTVQVRDRGPHRRQRILDVSPGVARRLGMGHTGTAMVSVEPLSAPGLTSRAEAATVRKGRRSQR